MVLQDSFYPYLPNLSSYCKSLIIKSTNKSEYNNKIIYLLLIALFIDYIYSKSLIKAFINIYFAQWSIMIKFWMTAANILYF